MTTRTDEDRGSVGDLAVNINANYKIDNPQQASVFRDFLRRRIKEKSDYYLFWRCSLPAPPGARL
jgi:hypothetical protein